jgi:hypothetical protein
LQPRIARDPIERPLATANRVLPESKAPAKRQTSALIGKK